MDGVYRDRVNRLFFLRKLESESYQDVPASEFASETEVREILGDIAELKLTNLNEFAQSLAYKYRLESTIPEQSSMDIVKEIEMFVDSLQVGLKSLNHVSIPEHQVELEPEASD